MTFLVSLINKIFEIGITQNQSNSLQRRIRICNQIAFSLGLNGFVAAFLMFIFDLAIFAYIGIASAILYGLIIYLNYLRLQSAARFAMSLVPALVVLVTHSIFIINKQALDALYLLGFVLIILPWLLFSLQELLAIDILTIINILCVIMVVPLSDFHQFSMSNAIFQLPVFTVVTNIFIIIILISFLYILKQDAFSAEQKNLKLIDRLQDQQNEIVTQNKELHQQRIELEVKEAEARNLLSELKETQTEISAQNEELLQQQEELKAVNDALQNTFQQLKISNQRLSKSINYAQNIQRVVLPSKEELRAFFSDFFTLYLPKDIVSGDFYWFQSIDAQRCIFVMADCTGHGVPGAFMSMIANTLLNEIVNIKKIINPADVILQLHHGIFYLLKQAESRNTDGMDLSICLFTQTAEGIKVDFSGAKQFIVYIQNNEIHQLNGDRISVGGGQIASESRRQFSVQTIILQKGNIIYLFSDGYIDQNNALRQRFGSISFKNLIKDIHHLPLSEQRNVFIEALQSHQQQEEQRDDISLVGLQV
ncbi:MAG: SpoIIE family protein phosphatase [Thermoflexibacter sp.]|nr:SpoIIE family protein phosphatase [Thermoflexibacter sp.]